MIRDYITHELQEIQALIEQLYNLEQKPFPKRDRDQMQRRIEGLEDDVKQQRSFLLKKSHPLPSAVYEFLTAIEDGQPANNTRNEWQHANDNIDCFEAMNNREMSEFIKSYYEIYLRSPQIDLDVLPAYSFVFRFTFILAQPYISRDEEDFYIIYNPVRKDKVFGLPYVASTSWKGSLLAALWQLQHRPGRKTIQDEAIYRLFGNKKGEEDEEKFHAGRLHFFPTFFTRKSLEIINPHDRELRTGKDPILIESVPIATPGMFTLLYVPFDRIGEDKEETRKQVADELKIVAKGIQALFRTYGFGAKTSDGFGLANEELVEGMLRLRPKEFESPHERPFSNFKEITDRAEEVANSLAKEGGK